MLASAKLKSLNELFKCRHCKRAEARLYRTEWASRTPE